MGPWGGGSAPVGRLAGVPYRWEFSECDEAAARRLEEELGLSTILARLLVNRGVKEPEAAQKFLYPRLEDLHDPFWMKDMDRVVERIERALDRGEQILIYGDYDVDGITSTVALKRALEMLGGRVRFYIPRRLEEGYGLKPEVIRRFYAEGCSLVLSVDSGIRAFEACQAARELGLDLIVTDHHLPSQKLPPAYAILNPKRGDCAYPDKELAAAGVVLKLIQALFERVGKGELVRHFLKLVAIGTVADMVLLQGENRVMVKLGLEALSHPHNLGLQALLNGAGVGPEVNHFDVGFKLAPRINAATRMGGGNEVVELFSVDDPRRARQIVEEMNDKNRLRQEEERKILAEIEERLRCHPEEFEKDFLVIVGQGWHRGVIGIVASRLVERFFRPVLVLSLDEDFCQGSGRSIPGFHLLEALEQCGEMFHSYGGHAQAVGCTLRGPQRDAARLRELAGKLQEYAARTLSAEQRIPVLKIESHLPLEVVSSSLYEDLQLLGPFGNGNPLPVFASHGVQLLQGPWLLKDRHLKFRVRANGSFREAIWWRNAAAAQALSGGSRLDLAYTLSRNSYQGEERIYLTIRDLRVHS